MQGLDTRELLTKELTDLGGKLASLVRVVYRRGKRARDLLENGHDAVMVAGRALENAVEDQVMPMARATAVAATAAAAAGAAMTQAFAQVALPVVLGGVTILGGLAQSVVTTTGTVVVTTVTAGTSIATACVVRNVKSRTADESRVPRPLPVLPALSQSPEPTEPTAALVQQQPQHQSAPSIVARSAAPETVVETYDSFLEQIIEMAAEVDGPNADWINNGGDDMVNALTGGGGSNNELQELDGDPLENPSEEEDDADRQLMHIRAANLRNDMPSYFNAKIDKFSSRLRQNPLTPERIASLITHLEGALENSKALATWASYATVILQFEQFDDAQTLESWARTDMATKMLLFLEHKRNPEVGDGILASSAHLYLKRLMYCYRRSKCMSELEREEGLATLGDYQKFLIRQGAHRHPNACRAITMDELRKLFKDLEDKPQKLTVFVLMFLTASRWEDISVLGLKDLKWIAAPGVEPTMLEVRWDQVKGSYRTMVDLIDLEQFPKVLHYLRHLNQEQKKRIAGKLASNHMRDSMRALFGEAVPTLNEAEKLDPEQLLGKLSLHSFKKAALCELAQAKYPLDSLRQKAKHRDEKMLAAYLDPRIMAEQRCAMEQSRVLAALAQELPQAQAVGQQQQEQEAEPQQQQQQPDQNLQPRIRNSLGL